MSIKKMSILFLLLAAPFYPVRGESPGSFPLRGPWAYITPRETRDTSFMERCLSVYHVLAITGFTLDKDGSLRCPLTPDEYFKLDNAAKGRGATVLPVITASVKNGTSILEGKCDDAAGRIALISRRYRIRAIHLDIEYLPPRLCHQMAVFIGKIKSQSGIPVTMAIFPQVGFPGQLSAFHDLEKLSPLLDGIVLMTYDLHGNRTAAGPVTDPGWAEQNAEHALRYMKPDRVWLGMPAYGYRWIDGPRRRCVVVSEREGKRLADRHGSARDRSLNVQVTGSSGGERWTVYYSDGETRRALERTASSMGLAGTALWRPGLAASLP